MNNLDENCVKVLNRLWHKLMYMAQCNNLEEQFSKLKELSTLEIGIINLVSHNPQIIFREICRDLDIPKSTLTKMIDRLEAGKYLQRVISHRDRRSYGLELTETGMLVQQEHLEFEWLICSQIVQTLDNAGEKQSLYNLATHIADKLNDNLKRSNEYE